MQRSLARLGDGYSGFRVIYKQVGYDFISCVYYYEHNADELAAHLRSLASVSHAEKIAVGDWPTPRAGKRVP